MTRYLFAVIVLSMIAMTPLHNNYEDEKNIRSEFENVYTMGQDEQFTVFNSTPNLRDLKDGQIVLISSGTYNKIMYRQNQEIFAVDVSCVTVRR